MKYFSNGVPESGDQNKDAQNEEIGVTIGQDFVV